MASVGWHIRLSYGPRWIIYIGGLGGMTVLVLLMNCYLNHLQRSRQDQGRDQFGAMQSERNPFFLQKDSDLSSWGSSHDSISQDDKFCEEGWVGGFSGGEAS